IIQECRENYVELTAKIKDIKTVQQKYGEIKQQISKAEEAENEKKIFMEELKNITHNLENNEINPEIQNELSGVEEQIAKIEYNPEKLAVVQAKINDWKWSELKFSQLEQAEHKLSELDKILPSMEKEVAEFRQNLTSKEFAREKENQLNKIHEELKDLSYN